MYATSGELPDHTGCSRTKAKFCLHTMPKPAVARAGRPVGKTIVHGDTQARNVSALSSLVVVWYSDQGLAVLVVMVISVARGSWKRKTRSRSISSDRSTSCRCRWFRPTRTHRKSIDRLLKTTRKSQLKVCDPTIWHMPSPRLINKSEHYFIRLSSVKRGSFTCLPTCAWLQMMRPSEHRGSWRISLG